MKLLRRDFIRLERFDRNFLYVNPGVIKVDLGLLINSSIELGLCQT